MIKHNHFFFTINARLKTASLNSSLCCSVGFNLTYICPCGCRAMWENFKIQPPCQGPCRAAYRHFLSPCLQCKPQYHKTPHAGIKIRERTLWPEEEPANLRQRPGKCRGRLSCYILLSFTAKRQHPQRSARRCAFYLMKAIKLIPDFFKKSYNLKFFYLSAKICNIKI